MKEQHPREEAIFDGALQLSPEQREAYLQAACHGDLMLMERIRDLICFHEKDDGPLETPAVPSPPKAPIVPSLPPGEKPGDKIGNYKILQLIGEGGCGSVFMAEQEQPVRRRVALKVIKLGMDTKNVIARFEAERQASHAALGQELVGGGLGREQPVHQGPQGGIALTGALQKRLALRGRFHFQRGIKNILRLCFQSCAHRDFKN